MHLLLLSPLHEVPKSGVVSLPSASCILIIQMATHNPLLISNRNPSQFQHTIHFSINLKQKSILILIGLDGMDGSPSEVRYRAPYGAKNLTLMTMMMMMMMMMTVSE